MVLYIIFLELFRFGEVRIFEMLGSILRSREFFRVDECKSMVR